MSGQRCHIVGYFDCPNAIFHSRVNYGTQLSYLTDWRTFGISYLQDEFDAVINKASIKLHSAIGQHRSECTCFHLINTLLAIFRHFKNGNTR